MKKLTLSVVMLFISQFLWAQPSPLPMLENTAEQIITTLKQNKENLKQKPQIIYGAVQRYLIPNVDLDGMSRSVLGRQIWSKASASEKKEFTQAFTQLVIRTYASPLAEYSDEIIKFLPLRSALDGRFTRINSIILRSSGQKIPLSYSLVAKNDGWKIYDLSVEGVSLLQSFRSQFAQSLQGSNIKTLIKQLQDANLHKKAA